MLGEIVKREIKFTVREDEYEAVRRAAEMLKEEITLSGPVRLKSVEEAQQRIVNIVRRLDEAEEIVISRGDEDVIV